MAFAKHSVDFKAKNHKKIVREALNFINKYLFILFYIKYLIILRRFIKSLKKRLCNFIKSLKKRLCNFIYLLKRDCVNIIHIFDK